MLRLALTVIQIYKLKQLLTNFHYKTYHESCISCKKLIFLFTLTLVFSRLEHYVRDSEVLCNTYQGFTCIM